MVEREKKEKEKLRKHQKAPHTNYGKGAVVG